MGWGALRYAAFEFNVLLCIDRKDDKPAGGMGDVMSAWQNTARPFE